MLINVCCDRAWAFCDQIGVSVQVTSQLKTRGQMYHPYPQRIARSTQVHYMGVCTATVSALLIFQCLRVMLPASNLPFCCLAQAAKTRQPFYCVVEGACAVCCAEVPPSPDATSGKSNDADYNSPGTHPSSNKNDSYKPDMDNASEAVTKKASRAREVSALQDLKDEHSALYIHMNRVGNHHIHTACCTLHCLHSYVLW